MKKWKVIFVLLTFFSCQAINEKKSDLDIIEFVDTVFTKHKLYRPQDELPEIFELTLIKKQQGDSLLSFSYYEDSVLVRSYDFNTKRGQFSLISEKGNLQRKLIVVDTFNLNLHGEELEIFKYEIQSPPIDGDIGILFSKKYGLIGHSAYSWGNKTILTNWNDIDFEEEMKKLLFVDSTRYLKRNQKETFGNK